MASSSPKGAPKDNKWHVRQQSPFSANGSKSSRVVSLRAISEKGVYRGSSSECESTDDDDDEEEEELPGDRFLRAPTPHPECPDDVERVVSSFWVVDRKQAL